MCIDTLRSNGFASKRSVIQETLRPKYLSNRIPRHARYAHQGLDLAGTVVPCIHNRVFSLCESWIGNWLPEAPFISTGSATVNVLCPTRLKWYVACTARGCCPTLLIVIARTMTLIVKVFRSIGKTRTQERKFRIIERHAASYGFLPAKRTTNRDHGWLFRVVTMPFVFVISAAEVRPMRNEPLNAFGELLLTVRAYRSMHLPLITATRQARPRHSISISCPWKL